MKMICVRLQVVVVTAEYQYPEPQLQTVSRKGRESLVRGVRSPRTQDRVILVQISAARRTEHVRSVLSQSILISGTDHY